MDKELRRKLGLKSYESELLHNELFKETTEYKYYLLGVAQGLYSIYKMLHYTQEKCQKPTVEDIKYVISESAKQESKINEYYIRLLKGIEEE